MTEFVFLYFVLAVIVVKCLVGFTVNLIMVMASFMKWKSLKSLQTCDQILSSLAISRGLGFFAVLVWNSIIQFFPWFLGNNIVLSAMYIQTMFMFLNTHWIATILCVFYCVKIVTYNYKLFTFLKTRISTMVPWLVLASLLISLISSLPMGWYGYKLRLQNLQNSSTENMTAYRLVIVQNFNNQFLIFTVGTSPPFLIFCVANSLLIHFLLIHTRRMRSNESHSHSPNLKCHFGAMKSMSLFLLLQIMSFLCMSLFTSGRFTHLMFPIMTSLIILCCPLFFHSLYMICTSSDVRKMFTAVCLCLIGSS